MPIVLPDGTIDMPIAPLTWTHSTLPAGATFNADSQTLRWTPSKTQAGTYQVQFTVADDGDGQCAPSNVTRTLTILVRNDNATPVVALANQILGTGDVCEVLVTANGRRW